MSKASRLLLLLTMAAASAVVMIASIWAENYHEGAALMMPGMIGFTIAGYLTLAGCAGHKRALQFWVVFLVFVGGISFPGRERTDTSTSIDFEIMLSLGTWAAMLAIGLANLPVSYRAIQRPPTAALLAYVLMALASVAYSPTPKFTLGAAFGLVCFFFFAAALVTRLEMKDFLWALFIALGLHVLLTPVLWAINPDLVYWKGWVDGHLTNSRLKGLTGHPYGFAGLCGLFIITSWALWRDRALKTSTFAVLTAIASCLLWFAHVRTAVAAIGFSLLLVGFRQRTAVLAAGLMGFYMLMLATLVMPGMVQNLAGLIARSDDLSDVTSLTGRTTIWATALDEFLERPLFGHGYGSTRLILTEALADTQEGSTPPHAHNAYIQSLTTMGIVGTAFFMVPILAQIGFLVRYPYVPTNAYIYFLLMMSMMSLTFMGMAPGTSTLIWMVMVFKVSTVPRTAAAPARSREVGVEALAAKP